MSIASQGGLHTVEIYQSVTSKHPNGANKKVMNKVSETPVKCMVQPTSYDAADSGDKRVNDVNAMITFWNDPGIEFNASHAFVYRNPNGTSQVHEFRGYSNESNLGRVFVVHTNYKDVDPVTLEAFLHG